MIHSKQNFVIKPGFSDTRCRRLANSSNLCLLKTRDNIKRLADEPKSAAWAQDGKHLRSKRVRDATRPMRRLAGQQPANSLWKFHRHLNYS